MARENTFNSKSAFICLKPNYKLAGKTYNVGDTIKKDDLSLRKLRQLFELGKVGYSWMAEDSYSKRPTISSIDKSISSNVTLKPSKKKAGRPKKTETVEEIIEKDDPEKLLMNYLGDLSSTDLEEQPKSDVEDE